MSRRNTFWGAGLVAAFGIAWLLAVRPASVRAQGPAAFSSSLPPGSVAVVHLGHLIRHLRVTGKTAAMHSYDIRVPHFRGPGGALTLTYLVPSGAKVAKGQVLARFDNTTELQNERNAAAQYDDLEHQVQDKIAQNASATATLQANLQAAEAALGTARLELRKAPVLSHIQAEIDQVSVNDAEAQIASLKISNRDQEVANAAALKILELQADQQKEELERNQQALQLMTVRAPLAGMVALVPSWNNGTFAPAQVGDTLWGRHPLLEIFDPQEMEVNAQISEADDAVLAPMLRANVILDAYPNATFTAHLLTVDPVATAAMGSPVRSFTARFKMDQSDPRILPDLSAAVDLEVQTGQPRLLVPRGAVFFVRGAAYVTRVLPDGQHRRQAVQLGQFDATNIVIASGLKAGDRVLVPGANGKAAA